MFELSYTGTFLMSTQKLGEGKAWRERIYRLTSELFLEIFQSVAQVMECEIDHIDKGNKHLASGRVSSCLIYSSQFKG